MRELELGPGGPFSTGLMHSCNTKEHETTRQLSLETAPHSHPNPAVPHTHNSQSENTETDWRPIFWYFLSRRLVPMGFKFLLRLQRTRIGELNHSSLSPSLPKDYPVNRLSTYQLTYSYSRIHIHS
jgi:hypothetical protein